jgi:hypothetical protein
MELYLPSLAVFFLVMLIVTFVVPKMTPLIMAVLSLVLLTGGIYHHWQLFSTEYRLSTWQDTLKFYAPGVFIGVVILFVIYGIFATFTGGEVPVPSMPAITMPSPETATNVITSSINNATQAVGNTTSAITNTAANAVNAVANAATNATNAIANGTKNLTRSFLEVI